MARLSAMGSIKEADERLRQNRRDRIQAEGLEIDKRRDRRESVVSYGSLAISILSLVIALFALCRPIQLDHHYTIAIPDFPALEHCERCDNQEQNDGDGNHGVLDGFDVPIIP